MTDVPHSAEKGLLLEALKALCSHQVFTPECQACEHRRLAVSEHLADMARQALTGGTPCCAHPKCPGGRLCCCQEPYPADPTTGGQS